MPAPHRPVDEHGLPLPVGIDGQPIVPRRRTPLSFGPWRPFLMLVVVGAVVAALWNTPVGRSAKLAIAAWSAERAVEKHLDGDLSGAIGEMDRALALVPDEERYVEYRGRLKLESHRVREALEDFDLLVRLSPMYAHGYTRRSVAYQRLERHADALRDLDRALELSTDTDPEPLNNRAYARAIANVDLAEGLADVERALEWTADDDSARSAYLDTRGYLLHLLGRHDEALADLETAIGLLEAEREKFVAGRSERRRRLDPRIIALQTRAYDESLAVMLHHRGLVLGKLGQQDRSRADLERAEQLGFDPAKGVY